MAHPETRQKHRHDAEQHRLGKVSVMISDLFGTPLLSGMSYSENLISADVESALIEGINSLPLAPFRFQGWLGKRLTASFGWRYDFDDSSFHEIEPLPAWLLPTRDVAAAFAGLAPDALVHALLTRYDAGAGIGWHRDRPVFEHVIGVSLGNPATMRFRRRRPNGFDRFRAPLAPRSAYQLQGEARHGWEHSIAPMDVPRWSITFRSLSAAGHAIRVKSIDT
ncbi:alpha-ketoglutarate-dependent dioxygenase AlkB [Sphingomonas sp. MMS12-HWE2-04]|uniref:alpha-ketoglutarate-dependent dioxygenase AlkB n=1 Tax=Sphingomonas sp. MMS12-HWE2-04 TaxID=3234199 RepID=UPI00384DC0AE